MAIAHYSATAVKIEHLTPSVRGLTLALDGQKTIPFQTGQWVYLHLHNQGTIIKRAFSIASPDHEQHTLHFCIKNVTNGIGSRLLFAMHTGDPISLSGPFGHFTIKPTTNDIVFIATGTGVAPYWAMVRDLLRKNVHNHITLLFGNRTPDEIIYQKEFEQLATTHTNFTFIPILSRADAQWQGEHGHVQDLVKKYIKPDNKNQDFYICGLKEMVLNVKELLEQMGFLKEHIYFERYN